jgi:heterodisulfide reductase subunit B
MMKIGYFPGCSLHGTAVEYDESLRAINSKYDIELEEVKDWNCCGATAAHSLNHTLSVALPARSLALAEQQGIDDMLVPCAACYSRLLSARHEILSDEAMQKKIPDIIEMSYSGTTKPFSILDYLEKYIVPGIESKVVKPFNKKVACYYGCLLVRPPKLVNVDRYEDPLMMENMLKKIGATPIDWAYKTECCGAGLSVARTDIVGKLSGKIVEDAVSRGAEAIIVACPMCQSNLDMRRSSIDTYLNKDYKIPVLFITEAIGMALGMSEKELGTNRHIVPVDLTFDKVATQTAKAKAVVGEGV